MYYCWLLIKTKNAIFPFFFFAHLQVCETVPPQPVPPVYQFSTNVSCATGQVSQTANVEDTRKQHELLLALKLKHGLTDEALVDTLR